jgi:membrane protein DedA with SNARE-associated domain
MKIKGSVTQGIILMVIGVAFQFLNIITYGKWGIDIDVIGLIIFIIGLIVTLLKWKTKEKKDEK